MGKLTISMAIFSSYVKLPEVLTHPHISLEVAIFRSEPQNTLANWLWSGTSAKFIVDYDNP